MWNAWYCGAAVVALHVIGNVAWYVTGKHAFGPSMWVAEAMTVAVPALVSYYAPRRERVRVARRALVSYGTLCILTSFTPVASVASVASHFGHTAFIASWALNSLADSVAPVCVACLVHTAALWSQATILNVAAAWILAWFLKCAIPKPRIKLHFVSDRTDVYRARHEVYADELGQYPPNPDGMLTDPTDSRNVYIVATVDGALRGFVAITPPGGQWGMHRHGVSQNHDDAYEVRLLTVLKGCRRQGIAKSLLFAAARYAEASGATHVEGMARAEVLPLYVAGGAFAGTDAKDTIQCGSVRYVHMTAPLSRSRSLDTSADKGMWTWVPRPHLFEWDLPFGMHASSACVHGGAGMESLRPNAEIVCADVLDAWYPPAPEVLSVVRASLEHSLMTTPPSHACELVTAIAEARGISPTSVLLGAGSSELIYRCFYAWLRPESRVLVMSPTYAEYEHILATIGCIVDVVRLTRDAQYDVRPGMIPEAPHGYDLVIFVNPNSPTGRHCERLADLIGLFGERTKIWVDETYIDFVGSHHSLERIAHRSCNVVVCKSMSKVFALSGTRVGYVCGHPAILDAVRARTPPWGVSRVAQRAAVAALASPEYYEKRIRETHGLREKLSTDLTSIGFDVVPGCANFIMCIPPDHVSARDVVGACREHGVYVRDVGLDNAVRIAVKDSKTNAVIVKTLLKILKTVKTC